MGRFKFAIVAFGVIAAGLAGTVFAQSDTAICQNYQACITACFAAENECTKGLDREGGDPKVAECRQIRDQCVSRQGCAAVFDQSDPDATGSTLALRAGCF